MSLSSQAINIRERQPAPSLEMVSWGVSSDTGGAGSFLFGWVILDSASVSSSQMGITVNVSIALSSLQSAFLLIISFISHNSQVRSESL